MAPHSSTLAWKIPWTEEPGGLQSMGLLRVGHDWATSLSCIGEGNGNPLQCSCLENPRDGGAWWAAVYGVAQRRTRLKQLSSSSRELRSCMPCSTSKKKRAKMGELYQMFLFGLIITFVTSSIEDISVPLNVNITHRCYCCLVAKSCLTLCDPMDCSLPGSPVHGISQARILEWAAISSSKRSLWLRDQTCIFCIWQVDFFTTELPGKPHHT